MERARRLRDEDGEIVRWAAVMGQEIDLRLLSRVSGASEVALLPALGRLQEQGLLRELTAGQTLRVTATEPGFALFDLGHSRRVLRTMQGGRDGVPITVFDYRYKTGSGKDESTHTLTAMLAGLPIRCPHLRIRPEHFGDRIASVFGFGSRCSPWFTVAHAALRIAYALMTRSGTGRPEMGKFSTARCVAGKSWSAAMNASSTASRCS